jgi:hemerythrin
MASFEWRLEYSVSVSRFDSDHKELFFLIGNLYHAMSEERERTVIAHVLQQMRDYSGRHFDSEETAMKQACYAGLQEHIAEHREFTRRTAQYYAEYTAGAENTAVDVLYFLRDWWQLHILYTDRNYSESLNRAGIH